MTLYLISTVRRRCPANEPSGYVYVVDLARRQVIQRCAIVEPLFRELDHNPRGGMRGGKGIGLLPDQAALANFSMILRYDPAWNLLGAITHPTCAGIHDILLDPDGIWVATARADLLLRFNLGGELERYFYLREPSPAISDLGWKAPVLLTEDIIRNGKLDFRDPRVVEKETYDRGHVNSLCLLTNGDLLVSLGFVYDEKFARFLRLKIKLIQWGIWPALKAANNWTRRRVVHKQSNMDQELLVKPARAQSALVRISADGERRLVLAMKNVSAPSHSLLALPDGTVIYLNTSDGVVLNVEPDTGKILSATQVSANGFLRGVDRLPDGKLLTGSRTELITFDISGCRVLDRLMLSSDPNEAVYDIKALPAHYALPPLSFAEDFTRQTGLSSPQDLLEQR